MKTRWHGAQPDRGGCGGFFLGVRLRRRLGGGRQAAIVDPQPRQNRLGIDGKIAPQPQETTCPDRQMRDQRCPVLAGKVGPRQRRRGNIGLLIGKMEGEIGVAEAPAGLADHPCPRCRGNRAAQRIKPQPCCCQQALVAARRVHPFPPKQIEQLPVLRAQRSLAGGALAQHGGKAVIEKHGFSSGGRRANRAGAQAAGGDNNPHQPSRPIRMGKLSQSDAKGALQSGTIAGRPNNISRASHPARLLFLWDHVARASGVGPRGAR